jgi:hypothetical protein
MLSAAPIYNEAIFGRHYKANASQIVISSVFGQKARFTDEP